MSDTPAPAPVSLRLRDVPAARGAQWVRQALRLFARKPLGFTALFTAFLFAALLALIVPYVGALVLLASMPVLTLAFMLASRDALADVSPTPALLVTPLRADARRRRDLLLLGLAYAVTTVIVAWVIDSVDDGAFGRLQAALSQGEAGRAEAQALLESSGLQWGMVLRIALMGLMSVPFWHAPALVYWGGQSVAQSLFSSTIAVWRARGAFFVYALAWAAVVVLFSLLLTLVFSVLDSREWVVLAAMPAGLMFSTVFYVSLHFTFVDSFEAVGPAEATPVA